MPVLVMLVTSVLWHPSLEYCFVRKRLSNRAMLVEISKRGVPCFQHSLVVELSLGLAKMRQAARNKRRKDEKEAAHAN
jgi:hypothetical protein